MSYFLYYEEIDCNGGGMIKKFEVEKELMEFINLRMSSYNFRLIKGNELRLIPVEKVVKYKIGSFVTQEERK